MRKTLQTFDKYLYRKVLMKLIWFIIAAAVVESAQAH